MDTIWSPWRSKYIESFKNEGDPKTKECFMCLPAKESDNDDELYVAARRKHCFVILNRFPYNNGHILVAPYRHIDRLDLLTDEELTEIMFTVREVNIALENMYHPHGYNMGLNIGRAAGAGFPGHLHYHIVPRWNGDTSFMSVIADVKVIPMAIEDTYHGLKHELEKM